MSNPGRVYALFNPSHPELIKIGKTTRSTQERVQEISSATGVPTPYIVIYEKETIDCDSAELIAHTLLEANDCRVNKNREFFKITIKEAIDIIDIACEKVGFNSSNSTITNNKIMINKLCEKFVQCYARDETGWRDLNGAIKTAEQLVNLNYYNAHSWLGDVYNLNDYKSTYNPKLAEYHFRQAIDHGIFRCFGDLAEMLDEQGRETEADAAWHSYFKKATFEPAANGEWGSEPILACTYIFNRIIEDREWHYFPAIKKMRKPMIQWIKSKPFAARFKKALQILSNE